MRKGNLFCEVNRDLRVLARADLETRYCLKKARAPFMHYCIQGVLRCPTVPPGTTTWMARPEPIERLREVYKPGYELIFCAFTSSSTDFRYACAMACYSVGTILELTLLEGFQLDELSLYPRENEVLLPLNKRFAVSSAGPTTKTVFSPVGEGCRSVCPGTHTSRVILQTYANPSGGGAHHQAAPAL